jgi:hypothetical protein
MTVNVSKRLLFVHKTGKRQKVEQVAQQSANMVTKETARERFVKTMSVN